MKSILIFAVGALVGVSWGQAAAPVATSTDDSLKTLLAWSMDAATQRGSEWFVLEKSGHESLMLTRGARVDSEPAGSDSKALIFDGTQTSAVATTGPVNLGGTAEFSLIFKPSASGTQMQTILKTNETYEIRLIGQSKRVDFIISLPDKKYTLVHLPCKPEVWNTLRARLQEGRLTLQVNDDEVTGAIPAGLQPVPVPNRVLIGWYGQRVYTGALANLVIRIP